MVETDRLIMHPFIVDDRDIVSLLYGDPAIMTYMPCECLTDEEIQTHLQKIVSDWNECPQFNYEMAVISKSEWDNQKMLLDQPFLQLKIERELAVSVVYSVIMNIRNKQNLPYEHRKVFAFMANGLIDEIFE